MKRRGNFAFLGKFSYFVPGISGMFALLGWLLVGGLAGGAVLVLLTGLFGDAITPYGNLISYPLMFVPPMLYASAKSSRNSINYGGCKLDSNHFSPVGAAMCVLLAVVGTLALSFWADGLIALLPDMPASLEAMLKELTNGNFFINFLTVSILAPLCEEWLCRGMVLRGLLRSTSLRPGWSIVISALFFALIHFNPWQAIAAFLMGCLFGYVYYRTGSLKLTMLMHFANNTFALVTGHIDSLKDADSWLDVMPVQQYAIIAAACFLLTALVVLEFRKVRLESPSGNFDVLPSVFESQDI